MLKIIKHVFLFLFFLNAPLSLLAEETCRCGIIEDDLFYRETKNAFDRAIDATFFNRDNHTFPEKFYNFYERPVYASEGIIYWFFEQKYNDISNTRRSFYEHIHTARRCVKWTDIRDPTPNTWGPDIKNGKSYEEFKNHIPFEHIEEESFEFHKNYTVIPKAFNALKKDVELEYKRHFEYYNRRISEFKNQYKIYDYTIQDFRNRLSRRNKTLKKN